MRYIVVGSVNLLVGALSLGACSLYPYMQASELPEDALTYIDFVPVDPPERTGDTLRIMTYNVGFLSGMLNNKAELGDEAFYRANEDRVVEMFNSAQPDIIAFQEIDYYGTRSHYVNQPAAFSERAAYPYHAAAINWDVNYLPYPYLPPRAHYARMKSGQSVLSRFPITVNQRISLPKPEAAPFFYNALYLDRLVQVTRVEIGKQPLMVINIHLEAFNRETRELQAPLVLEVVERYLDAYPVILLGDFNSVPPVATQQSEFLDEPGVDFSEETTMPTFLNCERLSEAVSNEIYLADESAWFTYPGDQPTRRLDYIFYSHETIEAVDAYVVHSVGDASDHLPVMLHFRFKDTFERSTTETPAS